MIRTFGRISRALARFARGSSGTASVEFAILFPPIFFLFASGIEAGLLMTRNVMLERSVDLAVRDLRLGTPTPPSYEELREQICQQMLLDQNFSCLDNLQVELQPVSSETWSPLNGDARCINREEEINPVDNTVYETGVNNDFMLVRVCIQVNPLLPNYALGAMLDSDGNNGYSLVATSAFVNEPSR